METEVWEEEKGVRVRNSELWFEDVNCHVKEDMNGGSRTRQDTERGEVALRAEDG